MPNPPISQTRAATVILFTEAAVDVARALKNHGKHREACEHLAAELRKIIVYARRDTCPVCGAAEIHPPLGQDRYVCANCGNEFPGDLP